VSDYDDDFMGGEGGGAPGFKFGAEIVGRGKKQTITSATVEGTIVDILKTQQKSMEDNEPLFWDDGKPRWQWNVTLQTNLRNWEHVTSVPSSVDDPDEDADPSEDTGLRRVFLKFKSHQAVKDAIRRQAKAFKAQGVDKPNLRVGDGLKMWVSGAEDRGKVNAAWLYSAEYKVNPKQADDDFGAGDEDEKVPAGVGAGAVADEEPPF
jgi:hypothetical protein